MQATHLVLAAGLLAGCSAMGIEGAPPDAHDAGPDVTPTDAAEIQVDPLLDVGPESPEDVEIESVDDPAAEPECDCEGCCLPDFSPCRHHSECCCMLCLPDPTTGTLVCCPAGAPCAPDFGACVRDLDCCSGLCDEDGLCAPAEEP
jgi:hypothetical protein